MHARMVLALQHRLARICPDSRHSCRPEGSSTNPLRQSNDPAWRGALTLWTVFPPVFAGPHEDSRRLAVGRLPAPLVACCDPRSPSAMITQVTDPGPSALDSPLSRVQR